MAGAAPELLEPPVNVLRLSLHPEGLATQIVNWFAWRAHVLQRVERQAQASGDAVLEALLHELAAYPAPSGAENAHDETGAPSGIAVPLRLRTPLGTLSFFSTTTVFGTPVDITLAELAIEAFFPSDEQTGEALRAYARGQAAT